MRSAAGSKKTGGPGVLPLEAMKRLRMVSSERRASMRLDEPRMSVAPLIDVCFLLLVYFMVTTTIKPAERDVSMEIPSPGVRAVPVTPLSVMIHVGADGAIVVNPGPHELMMSLDREERSLPLLEDHLTTLMVGVRELPPLLVRADDGAEHQRVVDVMNVLQKIGWARVGLVDAPEKGPRGSGSRRPRG